MNKDFASRYEYFRCPNTGKVLLLLPNDDKVMCSCGKVNPAVPTEYPGVHVVKTGLGKAIVLLERATVDDYIAQGRY